MHDISVTINCKERFFLWIFKRSDVNEVQSHIRCVFCSFFISLSTFELNSSSSDRIKRWYIDCVCCYSIKTNYEMFSLGRFFFVVLYFGYRNRLPYDTTTLIRPWTLVCLDAGLNERENMNKKKIWRKKKENIMKCEFSFR